MKFVILKEEGSNFMKIFRQTPLKMLTENGGVKDCVKLAVILLGCLIKGEALISGLTDFFLYYM